MVRLLYFAGFRERLGRSREEIAPRREPATVGSLVEELRSRGEPWSEVFAPGRNWRVAVNQDMAEAATPLRAGDEVAFFPPVTGG